MYELLYDFGFFLAFSRCVLRFLKKMTMKKKPEPSWNKNTFKKAEKTKTRETKRKNKNTKRNEEVSQKALQEQ